MRYCYIEERKLMKMFPIKTYNYISNKIIINKQTYKLSERRQKEIAKKIKKYLEKEEIEKIILSKELKKNKNFLKLLNNQGIKIIDGKILMKYLAKEIVQYISKKMNIEKQEMKVAILSNELTDLVIEKIKIFASEYKEVTVVTNHPKKILNLENELYTKYGASIIITNNRKKALLKQDIILNFDFIEEDINNYYINENAIIINFEDKIKIYSKRFIGINIFDYQIICKNEESIDFEIKDIIEGKINFNTSFYNVRKMLKEKEINIKSLATMRENII